MATINKILLLVVFLAAVSSVSSATEHRIPSGKWYGYVGRSHLLEYNFMGDSIRFSRLNYDGTTPDSMSSKTSRLVKTIFQNGNMYLFLERVSIDDSSTYLAMNTLRKTHNHNEILCAINPGEKRYAHVDSSRFFIAADTIEKIGWKMFNTADFKKYLAMRPIEDMNRADVMNYFHLMISDRDRIRGITENPRILGSSFYEQYAIREVVRKIGYSPLYSAERFNAVVEKFKDDKEIQNLIATFKGSSASN